ncbi:MAG: pilin [Candidatus Falkowbacteria bacterium]
MLKSFPKILTIFFLSVFIVQLICLAFLLTLPQISQAADPIKFKPQVGIPVQKQAGDTFDFSGNTENIFPKDGSTKPIAEYIRVVYKYAIGIVGILAAVVLMIGGVLWIVAGGNATMIGEAKAWIGASLTGLVLALSSYLILATVNPALVNLVTTPVQNVQPNISANDLANIMNNNPPSQDCIKNGGTPIGLDSNDSTAGYAACHNTKCKSTVADGNTYTYNGSWYFCCKCVAGSDPGQNNFCQDAHNIHTKCKLSSGGDGYCEYPGNCLPCRIKNDGCSNSLYGFSTNYECCNGSCNDAPGIGTGNICN